MSNAIRNPSTPAPSTAHAPAAAPATLGLYVGIDVAKQKLDLARAHADDDFKHLDGLLQSVPGVGPTLAATLAADLRELGAPDRRTVCALAGVAPFPDDSGTIKGKRSIRGGRADVRCVLYMATLAAIRVNPVIRPFARRLREAGKVAKLTIVACMRKLLSLLNAMVRDDLSWDQLEVVKKLASTH